MKTLIVLLFSCGFLSVLCSHNSSDATVKLAVVIPWSQEWQLGPYMGSGIVIGLETVADRQLLPSTWGVTWEWRDTYCKPRRGLVAAVELWSHFETDPTAFIGGGCSVVCEPVALLSAAWNLPYVSFGCTSESLSNKYDYPTFTRSIGKATLLSPMFRMFVRAMGWTRVGVVTTTESVNQLTANVIKLELEADGSTVFYHTFQMVVDGNVVNPKMLQKQKEIVRAVKSEARIIIMCMYDNDIMHFLLSALEEGMNNGDYVFVVLDADPSKANATDSPEGTREAYEGLLSANVRTPTGQQWDEFTDRVREAFNDYRFDGFPRLGPEEEVQVYAGLLHDAVLQWAYGVNLTLAEGGSHEDGLAVTANIFNLTYEGVTGTVVINEEGDRNPDYSMEMLTLGRWVKMFDYLAVDQSLVPIRTDNLPWKGGRTSAPPDSPPCGWEGEFCPDASQRIMVSVFASICVLIVVASLIFVYCYRRIRFEAELNAINLWNVDWSEVKITGDAHGGQGAQSSTNVWTSCMTLGSGKSSLHQDVGGERQLFCEIATCRGKLVAIKRVAKGTVDVHDRQILLEMKQMRDMHQENVNLFVGACVEAPNVCVLMMYAQKGSLQDVLQNEAIKLTLDFKISIATDIDKGMAYLHNSPFESHGHLTSSNCVIDSRWTCKITDYGLTTFKATGPTPTSEQNLIETPGSMLWTAPELLRLDKKPPNGTATGDVFSYGIILQEIVTNDAPYALDMQYDTQDIVRKVKAGAVPLFRPTLPEDCDDLWRQLIEACWDEDPTKRPTFVKIRNHLKAINGGRAINVIDNMIKMLEKHAEHLEDLVAERTQELDEEKKKVEILLYSILPRAVADQLKLGNQVEPESFEAVTIYFSDVVGFTKLAAASTPIQVVNLLNALYSTFDEITDKYDVYKVETIGDAYMVVSGLPTRNGDRHAAEIATLSLHLLSGISAFRIPHLPDTHLQLRIGMHTGPAVAGVVGMKMPRYCLFGDTVNTASRMESSGYALRVHMSSSTAALLEKTGEFFLTCRGEISVKGKAPQTTYWLTGKKGFNLPLPDLSQAASTDDHEFK